MSRLAFLEPGNMPLFLAWLIAIFGVPACLFFLAVVAGQTALDVPLYLALMLGSTLATMFVAKARHRRWLLWGFIAGTFLMLQVLTTVVLGPIFQPVTALVAVYLAHHGNTGYEGLPVHDRLATIEATAAEMDRDEPAFAPIEPAVAEPEGDAARPPADIRTRPRPRAERRPYSTHRRPRH